MCGLWGRGGGGGLWLFLQRDLSAPMSIFGKFSFITFKTVKQLLSLLKNYIGWDFALPMSAWCVWSRFSSGSVKQQHKNSKNNSNAFFKLIFLVAYNMYSQFSVQTSVSTEYEKSQVFLVVFIEENPTPIFMFSVRT